MNQADNFSSFVDMPTSPIDKDKRITELEQEVKALKSIVIELMAINKDLLERLAKYENPKNSRNSSMPPSKDENRPKRTSSLRTKTGKKPGGQEGREGSTLRMFDNPDVIIELVPEYCNCCGRDIGHIAPELAGKRQVIDLPEIKFKVTEHQIFKRLCTCGHTTQVGFPSGVDAPISYGQNMEALTGYFHARQYLPFARMKELFNDVFNIEISEGGIHCLLNRFSDKASNIYQTIRERVQKSEVVGGDETGAKVNGKKQWFWTWQTPRLTYIAHSESRGAKTINKHFPLGFPNSTFVSDAWRAQLNTPAQDHQCCVSHLQRNLGYLNQLYPGNIWGNSLLKVLYDSLELKRNMEIPDYYGKNHERDKILERFDLLILEPPPEKQKEMLTFYKRISRDRKHVFTFLFIPEVPPDNNASERAIRNVKVKQKISGQFKTTNAAQNFAKIRSVIDTTIKNGLNVLEALSVISKFGFQSN